MASVEVPQSVQPVELEQWDLTMHPDGKWIPANLAQDIVVHDAERAVDGASVTDLELRVLTFNIWFADRHQAERTEELLRILDAADADVVALQEVTERSASWILSSPMVRDRYLVTSPSLVTLENWYGMMTLVARRLQGIHRAEYCSFGSPLSTLGRGLLRVDVAIEAKASISVGNVHLESPVQGVTADHRASQLRLCTSLLQQPAAMSSADASIQGCILVGDFNFVDEAESARIGERGFLDCWTCLKETPTPTFDYRRNQNITKRFISRPDRITCSKGLRPQGVELVGEQPILSTGLPPSDHFGLFAAFKVEHI